MIAAVLRTQLVLLLRGPVFWIVTAGSVALAVLSTNGRAISNMLMMFTEMTAPFLYLAQMLVSTFSAQRERTDRVDELIEAMPYRPAAWIMSRYLLLWLVWMALSLLLWAVGALMVWSAGQPLDMGLLLLNWATVAPITLAFTTAVGFAMGTFLRRGVTAYFLTTALWISGPALMVILSKGTNRLPVPIFEYFASGRAFPLTTTGWYPNGELLLWNRLFVFGATGVLLSLIVWLGARRRKLPRWGALLALLLCATITTGATGKAQQIWGGRYAAYDAEVAALPSQVVTAPGALRTNNYDLHIELQPTERLVRVTGSFDLVNPGTAPVQSAAMTLRHNFLVTALTGPDGQPVPFERHDDLLLIQVPLAPGEAKRLSATWQGEVYHWRLRDGPKLGAHVSAESFFLPAHYGWYPIPGHFTPSMQSKDYLAGTAKPVVVDLLPPHHPASFSLSVTGTALHLVHNGDQPVPGLFVVGTPFETVRYGNVDVTVSPTNRVQGALLAQEASSVFDFFQSLIPLGPAPLRVVEMHDNSYYGATWDGDRQAAPSTLLVHHIDFGQFRDGYVTKWNTRMIALLWWPVRHLLSEQNILYQDLVTYMLQLWKDDGATTPLFKVPWSTPLQVLEAIEETMGRDAAVQVLRELHALRTDGGPTEADFDLVAGRIAGHIPAVANLLPVGSR